MGIEIVIFYRAMKKDIDGLPVLGNDSGGKLGIRDSEIPINERGNVEPGIKGLSVTEIDPKYMVAHRRPKHIPNEKGTFNGTGKDPVYYLESNNLSSKLSFILDNRPEALKHHVLIIPSIEMTLEEYRNEIAKTRNNWEILP